MLSYLSTTKLIRMVKKGQKLAIANRKKITLPRALSRSNSKSTSSLVLGGKGNFVVYTSDERRFSLPLMFLQSEIFIELLRWAEEVFGLTTDEPITLPCDSIFMKYVISIIQGQVSRKVEEALILSLSSIASSSSSSSVTCLQHERLPAMISCC